jgi:hypothetical protein
MATFTSGSRRGWGCDSSALLDDRECGNVQSSICGGAIFRPRRKSSNLQNAISGLRASEEIAPFVRKVTDWTATSDVDSGSTLDQLCDSAAVKPPPLNHVPTTGEQIEALLP